MIDHTIRNKVRVANSHGLATGVTVAAQTTVLLLGLCNLTSGVTRNINPSLRKLAQMTDVINVRVRSRCYTDCWSPDTYSERSSLPQIRHKSQSVATVKPQGFSCVMAGW